MISFFVADGNVRAPTTPLGKAQEAWCGPYIPYMRHGVRQFIYIHTQTKKRGALYIRKAHVDTSIHERANGWCVVGEPSDSS